MGGGYEWIWYQEAIFGTLNTTRSMQGYLWRVFSYGIIPIIMSMTLIQEVGEAFLFSFFVIIRPNQGGFTWIQFINIAFGIIMAHLIFLWILKFFLFLLSCSIWLQICLLERLKLKTTIEFKNNIKKQHWGTWRGRNQFVFNIFLSSSKFPRIPWRYPFLCV